MRWRSRSGFSLIETMVLLPIAAIMLLLLFRLWSGAERTEARQGAVADAMAQAALLMNALKQDFRSADSFEATETGVRLSVVTAGPDGAPRDASVTYESASSGWVRLDPGGARRQFVFPGLTALGQRMKLEVLSVSDGGVLVALTATGPKADPQARLSERLLLGAASFKGAGPRAAEEGR